MRIKDLNQMEKERNDLRDFFVNAATEEIAALQKIKGCYAKEACPDQLVGRIEKFSLGTDFPVRVNIQDGFKRTSESCVILILESPHKDEFFIDKDRELKPIGPARGCTGCAIRNYFTEIFPGHVKSDLVLVNLVQFQCSLGLSSRGEDSGSLVKNRMLERLLCESCQNRVQSPFTADFIRRVDLVKGAYGQQVKIINACTRTGGWNDFVNELLTEYKAENGINHPSTWCRTWKSVKNRLDRHEGNLSTKPKTSVRSFQR